MYFCKCLYAKAQEMSLNKRRTKLYMNYGLKLKTCRNIPAYSCVFEQPNSKRFENSNLTPPLGLRIEDASIDLDVADDITLSDTLLGASLNPRSVCL